MGVLIMLNKTGDSRMTWDPKKPAEVKAAKAQFDELIGNGQIGIASPGDGYPTKTFDPAADEMVVFAQLQGG